MNVTIYISRLQRWESFFGFNPGALPLAIEFHAFGVKTKQKQSVPTGRAEKRRLPVASVSCRNGTPREMLEPNPVRRL
jgi:hypothetical protein